MIRVNEAVFLDFMEEEVLFILGCKNYEAMLERLCAVCRNTMDPDMREKIVSLQNKLSLFCPPDHYEEVFEKVRKELATGMKSRVKWAKELLDYQLRKVVA